jgi:DNA-binding transcriptional MerR regulator
MRSGELARQAGVSSDTLRHYERKGLLPPPRRSSNGYRVYPGDAPARVQLIRRALAIGFSLDELARILAVRDRGGAPCHEVRVLAAEKLAAIEQRLRDLKQLRTALRRTIAGWDDRLERSSGRRAALLEHLPDVTTELHRPLKPKREAVRP